MQITWLVKRETLYRKRNVIYQAGVINIRMCFVAVAAVRSMAGADRFQDVEYVNWVKAGLALICTSEGIYDLCNDKITNYHRSLHRIFPRQPCDVNCQYVHVPKHYVFVGVANIHLWQRIVTIVLSFRPKHILHSDHLFTATHSLHTVCLQYISLEFWGIYIMPSQITQAIYCYLCL